jgi:TolB-like protein/Flp pilus assembly protein TadD
VPAHIQSLVSRLLQKDRNKRTATLDEVAAELKAQPASASPKKEENSIAVLYFENMSSEKESEYFCAGITEDIITDLSKIKGLKVVSRSDVMPFRNKEANSRQIGEALRVNYILEGSVRKSGNKIRITAQLIDVKNGFHAWAERFDRLIEDIFDLQNEVSQNIAGALKITLTDSEKESLAKKPTTDLRAYDFYMRGREFLFRRGRKNNERAIPMFENALELDPKFVSAYSALVEAYSCMYIWYDGDPKWLAKIITLNERALAVDPNSIDALFGAGMVFFHQKRFGEAKRTLEKVAKLKPDLYDAFRWLGIISDITGSYDDAIAYYTQCAALKPFSEEPWLHIDMTQRRKGNRDGATEAVKTILELGTRKLEVNPEDTITLSRLASVYVRLGQPEKGIEAIRKILAIDPTDGLALYNAACTYADLGNKEETLSCLRRALNSGYKGVLEWVKSDPDFSGLIEDPEFKALLAEFA